ncbi:hypothetical protein NEHOM01_0192 [Nematocida homosporus]|uniref:uncharacterized protein n=1 Tax=Nematocida homosporus TaxID=1912981 RepID=UPI00221EA995|nr:uncharacterized protein NEHOM01_0192 [Nematocida homosporus]KAI5184517.1 hypothetical protein NEHOM01_0192 [Nematocida homosporus]
MLNQFNNLTHSLKPKHALISAGIFFILLGFLLMDTHLVFVGNTLTTIGVLCSIQNFQNIKPLILFLSGFAISFKLTHLAIFIEFIALLFWSRRKLGTLSHPIRHLTKFLS